MGEKLDCPNPWDKRFMGKLTLFRVSHIIVSTNAETPEATRGDGPLSRPRAKAQGDVTGPSLDARYTVQPRPWTHDGWGYLPMTRGAHRTQ